MISFIDFKKSLGSTAQKMSDEKIEQLRQYQDKLSEAIFEVWLKKRNANLKPKNEIVGLPEKREQTLMN